MSLGWRISLFKWNVSRNLYEETLKWHNSVLATSFPLKELNFLQDSRDARANNSFARSGLFYALGRAFAHIQMNALLLVRFCVLMVSRNGVTSRRQFSFFSTTASLIPPCSFSFAHFFHPVHSFSPFLHCLFLHLCLAFWNVVFALYSYVFPPISLPFHADNFSKLFSLSSLPP